MIKKLFILLCVCTIVMNIGCGKSKQDEVKKPVIKEWKQVDFINDFFPNDMIVFNNKFYFATDKGLFESKDGKDRQIAKIDILKEKKAKIRNLAVNNNMLFIGTDRGIGMLSNTFKFQIMGIVNQILPIESGKLAVLANDGIYIVNNSFKIEMHFDSENSFFAQYKDNEDISERLLKVNSGAEFGKYYYFATDEGLAQVGKDLQMAKIFFGDYLVPSLSGELIKHQGNSPLPGNMIKDVKVWNSKILLATNGGLSIYVPESNNWHNLTSDHYEKTKRGSKWQEILVPGNTDMIGNYVNDINVYEDKAFISTNKGLNLLNLKTNKIEKKLLEGSIKFSYLKDDTLFVSSDFDGLYIFRLQEVIDENSNR
ncbi:MAG: hypothetical protein C0601_08540 [Candidatus Muiribacterium halophilum]|uniref:Uncharacterized protein n=1 Tax=Muiribacterium halophilum TaxID=2053465 RepID=A0A2N5ZEB4_MUIH1|nr:MAG: hypothetical protein C0601_08540 [Candidatus Muirbacterium halophilum]